MSKKNPKTINLALQGGGAHGAFTWGVLDYLLEDGRLDFDGVSATSAGAMNAAALAQGKSTGGTDGAREALENFWSEIAKAGAFYSPVKRTPMEMAASMNPWMPDWSLGNSPYFAMFEAITHAISPYQFNPLNFNPLRDVLEKTINFDQVNACECLNIFINATNVRTGYAKVFHNKEVTMDVLLASAALPFLFQAQEIEGEAYWDGGYMGNPSLWPLFYQAECRDILIIHVNPVQRDDIPKEAYMIENRINEITFNASFLKEIRSIAFVKKLIHQDMLKDEYKDQYKDILIHAIRADEALKDLSIASKFDTDWGFLTHLRDLGRAQAKTWLENHYKDVGKRDSVDIEAAYLAA